MLGDYELQSSINTSAHLPIMSFHWWQMYQTLVVAMCNEQRGLDLNENFTVFCFFESIPLVAGKRRKIVLRNKAQLVFLQFNVWTVIWACECISVCQKNSFEIFISKMLSFIQIVFIFQAFAAMLLPLIVSWLARVLKLLKKNLRKNLHYPCPQVNPQTKTLAQGIPFCEMTVHMVSLCNGPSHLTQWARYPICPKCSKHL